MNAIKGKLHGVMTDDSNNLIVSFAVSGVDIPPARRKINELKQYRTNGKELLKIEADIWRENRSLDANAYLHVLLNKISEVLNTSMESVKKEMVLSYGTLMLDSDGDEAFIKLPAAVDINKIYKYTKWIADRMENGIEYKCYLIYKRTSELNSAEFSRLLDGVISEAQELGIETKTPEQIAKMMNLYENINV